MFSITTGEFKGIQEDLGRAVDEPPPAKSELPDATPAHPPLANPFSALRWRRDADGGESAGHPAHASHPVENPSILVVDDDDDVRNMTVAVLEHAGYTVLAAVSAPDAFRLLETIRKLP
ncbi:MAG: hypothetical protein WDO24_09175 [Pseudomonadota bacterium]